MTKTNTTPRTWINRGLAASAAAAALTATSVMGGATMTAQGPEHTPISAAVSVLNPVSAEPAAAYQRSDGKWNPDRPWWDIRNMGCYIAPGGCS